MAGWLAPAWVFGLRGICSVVLGGALCVSAPVSADPAPERVRGFFCSAKEDSVAFLLQQAKGEEEEIAANNVNKRIAKFSCAYYLPAAAIPTGERTVIEDGLVFKLQSYMFLPEKVERWTGTVFGSMQNTGSSKADI